MQRGFVEKGTEDWCFNCKIGDHNACNAPVHCKCGHATEPATSKRQGVSVKIWPVPNFS